MLNKKKEERERDRERFPVLKDLLVLESLADERSKREREREREREVKSSIRNLCFQEGRRLRNREN